MNKKSIKLLKPEDKQKVIKSIRQQDNYARFNPESDHRFLGILTSIPLGDILEILGVEDAIIIDTCGCGSDLDKRPLHDANGIFCCYFCDECENQKRRQYNAQIFNDPNFPDGPIEESE